MEKVREEKKVLPLLVKHAVLRSEGEDIPGYYSENLDMWVVEKKGREVPLIDLAIPQSELVTKTKSSEERDDEEQTYALSLVTKTHVQLESDDEQFSVYGLAELATKTDAKTERDD